MYNSENKYCSLIMKVKFITALGHYKTAHIHSIEK